MRKLFAVLSILIFSLFAFGSGSALAQETCTNTEQPFHAPDDFPLDGGAWEMTFGTDVVPPDIDTDVDPDGFRIVGTSDDGLNQNVGFRLDFPSPVTITDISLDAITGSDDVQIVFAFCDMPDCNSEDADVHSLSDTPPFTYDFPDDQTGIYTVFVAGVCAGVAGTCELDNFTMDGTIDACLFRPVLTVDVISDFTDGVFSTLATTAGARVFAIDDGTVVGVYHDSTGYRVVLVVNDVDPVQYSNLEIAFASVGDVVNGGCVLGYAGVPPPGVLDGLGYLLYQHDSDLTDWHDYGESLSNTPCNANDSNCLNANPEFNDAGASWKTRFALADSLNTGEDSMTLLPPGGWLYQEGFQVTTSDTYYVTLAVSLVGVATHGTVSVWIGGTGADLPFTTNGGEFVTVSTAELTPTFDGTSEFRIVNNDANTSTLKITFACLHTGDVLVAPPPCYFEDASLSLGDFTMEGGATFEDSILGVGRYSLPPDGIIRSAVDLSALSDADSDFHLSIQAAAPSGATDVTASIVDSGDDSELLAIGNYSYSSILWTDIVRPFTINASDHLVGDLYIKNTGAQTVLISALCLSSDTGSWPGFSGADFISTSILPITCTSCSFPESLLDVVAWLNWLGCLFNYLIYCLLYTLVNNIWATIVAIGSGLGLLGRWLGLAIAIIGGWLLQLGSRLLASFIGNLIPILNAILAWILSLPFVQAVLDQASLAAAFFDGVWQFIMAVISLFVTAITFMVAMVNLVTTVWVAFINAIGSPATVSFPFPDCVTSTDLFYDACIPLDVMNWFIDNVPALGLIFVAASVGRLWIRIQSFRQSVEEIFQG